MIGNASSTSEFVRQELRRAIVGARTQQQQQQRIPNNIQNNLSGQVSQDDLEALGLTFEMSSAGTSIETGDSFSLLKFVCLTRRNGKDIISPLNLFFFLKIFDRYNN